VQPIEALKATEKYLKVPRSDTFKYFSELYKSAKRCIPVASTVTVNLDQTKPKFFVKAPRGGAFTKNLVVGLFSICCRTFQNPKERGDAERRHPLLGFEKSLTIILVHLKKCQLKSI